MKRFIKDNLVLALGISLPVLLVIVFLLASALPNFFVKDPQYGLLFSTQGYGNAADFIVKRRAVWWHVPPSRSEQEMTLPRLFRYRAATGKIEEIFVAPPDLARQTVQGGARSPAISPSIVIPLDPKALPTSEQARDTSKLVTEMNQPCPAPHDAAIAELAALRLDDASLAPDGYCFAARYSTYDERGHLFLIGVHSGAYRTEGPMLIKGGKSVPLPYANSDYDYHQLRFLGWIVP